MCYRRRVCKVLQHSWVCVVGTTEEYATVQDFLLYRCLPMKVRDFAPQRERSKFFSVISGGSQTSPSSSPFYSVHVEDTVIGSLRVEASPSDDDLIV